MSETQKLAQALIQKASITPEDAGCQSLIAERLKKIGFTIESLRFESVDNLWACVGDEKPLFVFLGHTDVVPTGPEADWQHPPFAAEIHDQKLFGRGAADMKGAIAAMIVACERLLAEQPALKSRIAFLLTSDEEGPAVHGTTRVVDWLKEQGETPNWCLIGEPSCDQQLGDTLRIGRRGSLHGLLTIEGKQGHIAYPQLADNPIHRLGPVLSALCHETWDEGHPDFPPTSFQISKIESSEGAENVIPGTVSLRFNFRYSPATSQEKLQARVVSLLDQADVNYHLSWRLSGQPFLSEPGELIESCKAVIMEHTGLTTQPSTGGGTSDGRFMARICPELVELGLKNETIHQVNEHVDVADLDRLTDIYEGVLRRLCLAAP